MSPGAHTERAFEDRVEYELLLHGWERASDFTALSWDLYRALWSSSGRTQIKKWNKLIELYGGDPDVAQRQFALRVAPRSTRGACWMCCGRREGPGVQIDLAYFRPGIRSPRRADEYNANILAVARQLHFSSVSQPVCTWRSSSTAARRTAELKNPNTGQNADHAIAQYRAPTRTTCSSQRTCPLRCHPTAFITTGSGGYRVLPFNVGSNGRKAGGREPGPFGY